MKDDLHSFSVREVGNVFEISIHSSTVDEDFLDEATAIFAMLFFQTRKHIKVDLTPVDYLPQEFILKLFHLARDLRDKKRVLILVGIPRSLYHCLERFQLKSLFYLPDVGLFKTKTFGSAEILPPAKD